MAGFGWDISAMAAISLEYGLLMGEKRDIMRGGEAGAGAGGWYLAAMLRMRLLKGNSVFIFFWALK